MNKNKSMIVTALFIVMLLGIVASLYKLWAVGFYILAGIFAVYGIVLFTVWFFRWLRSDVEKEDLSVPVVEGDPDFLGEDFRTTYEAIRDEMRNGTD